MQMNLHLGDAVTTQDGKSVGDVKHLMMNKNEVTHVVVGGDPDDDRLRLVASNQIGKIMDAQHTITLNVTKSQYTQLPEFDEKKFAESRGYADGLDTAMGGVHAPGQGSESFAVGGYSLDPLANLNPPGVVDENSSNSR